MESYKQRSKMVQQVSREHSEVKIANYLVRGTYTAIDQSGNRLDH